MPRSGFLPDNAASVWRAAYACCLVFGILLAFRGLAALVIDRIITGGPPSAELLIAQSPMLVLAGSYVGLFVCIQRKQRWAIWLAYLLSLTICVAAAAAQFAGGAQVGGTFLIILSGVTSVANWLALAPGELAASASAPSAPQRSTSHLPSRVGPSR